MIKQKKIERITDFVKEIDGIPLTLSVRKLSTRTGNSVMVQYGDTVVLTDVVVGEKFFFPNFLPLKVLFLERYYALNRIPGSFFRREGRPSDYLNLVARFLDRSLRSQIVSPLDISLEIQCMILAWDGKQDLFPLFSLASITSLFLAGVKLKDKLVSFRLNAESYNRFFSSPKKEDSFFSLGNDLTLTVTGKGELVALEFVSVHPDADLMLEKEFPKILKKAEPFFSLQNRILSALGSILGSSSSNVDNVFSSALPEEKILEKFLNKKKLFFSSAAKKAVDFLFLETETRKNKEDFLKELISFQWESFKETEEFSNQLSKIPGFDFRGFKEAFSKMFYLTLSKEYRKHILETGIREDGRSANEHREIETLIGLLPNVHGSAFLRRGGTEVLSVATIAPLFQAREVEDLRVKFTQRFFHFYNFNSFAINSFIKGYFVNRRELGHGNLAQKALQTILLSSNDFPYVLRVVSDIFGSDGSTSQAAIIASSLALKHALVPIRELIAGVSVGMISENGKKLFLVDLIANEDFFGDMDCKVARSSSSLVIQLDLKLPSISFRDFFIALTLAKDAIKPIINSLTGNFPVDNELGKKELSPQAKRERWSLPYLISFTIDTSYVGKLIGPKGAQLKRIIEDSGVTAINFFERVQSKPGDASQKEGKIISEVAIEAKDLKSIQVAKTIIYQMISQQKKRRR